MSIKINIQSNVLCVVKYITCEAIMIWISPFQVYKLDFESNRMSLSPCAQCKVQMGNGILATLLSITATWSHGCRHYIVTAALHCSQEKKTVPKTYYTNVECAHNILWFYQWHINKRPTHKCKSLIREVSIVWNVENYPVHTISTTVLETQSCCVAFLSVQLQRKNKNLVRAAQLPCMSWR